MTSVVTDDKAAGGAPAAKKNLAIRLAPLGVIALALAAFFGFGLNEYFSLDALRDNKELLQNWVSNSFFLALLVFTLVYAGAVAISFPGASFLTIIGGFLFGLIPGTIAVVTGATFGATVIYFVSKSALGDALTKKAGGFVKKMEQGLRENELSYMFLMRLIPGFPFWVVNLVPGALGVKFRNFLISTFFGIMPGTFVYVSIGNGIGAALDSGEEIQLSGLFLKPEVLLPVIGLAVLALVPIIYKKFIAKKSDCLKVFHHDTENISRYLYYRRGLWRFVCRGWRGSIG